MTLYNSLEKDHKTHVNFDLPPITLKLLLYQVQSFDSHRFLFKFLNSSGSSVRDGTSVEYSLKRSDETLSLSFDPLIGLMINGISELARNTTYRLLSTTEKCSQYRGHDHFELCILHYGQDDMESKQIEFTTVKESVNRMSSRLRNYTCSDVSLDTSQALYSTTFKPSSTEDTIYQSDILMESPHAKIWLVHDLITADECEALKAFGGPKLKRALVADNDGGVVVSEGRKAQQARYLFNSSNINSDYLYPLFKKVFSITNDFAGYTLNPDGQEEFMVIQYNKDDQYTPHCDGSCDGSNFSKGGRVATAVLYCETATIGGGTTFTQSDIFVKPKKGMGAFFSYKGSDGVMDTGFTEHSGCPVIEGEKWISTVWMREGVTAEKSHQYYDPRGFLLKV